MWEFCIFSDMILFLDHGDDLLAVDGKASGHDLADIAGAEHGNAPADIEMIDIDHFKTVNDTYGHDVGDLVLADVARQIVAHADTRVCRWGGEEFVVWFADSRKACDPEAIRRGVAEMSIQVPYCDKAVQVTVSIGVASGTGDLKQLVRAADEAMFRAKENGRNRVEYAGS